MKNSDMPASPTQYQDSCNGELYSDNTGLTKREAFAMAAMQGLLSSAVSAKHETFAASAVKMADTLLKELDKEQ